VQGFLQCRHVPAVVPSRLTWFCWNVQHVSYTAFRSPSQTWTAFAWSTHREDVPANKAKYRTQCRNAACNTPVLRITYGDVAFHKKLNSYHAVQDAYMNESAACTRSQATVCSLYTNTKKYCTGLCCYWVSSFFTFTVNHVFQQHAQQLADVTASKPCTMRTGKSCCRYVARYHHVTFCQQRAKVAKLLLNAVFACNVPQYLNKHTSMLLL